MIDVGLQQEVFHYPTNHEQRISHDSNPLAFFDPRPTLLVLAWIPKNTELGIRIGLAIVRP